jgi:hypothetical protein
LTGNYSLESTLFGKPAAIASTSSDLYGTTKPLGENITAAQAKTSAFYAGIGWDFTDTWKILADGYPVLKWQTTPVNTSILKLESYYSLTKETSIDLKNLVSSHGLTLSFSETSDDIAIADGVVTSENGAFPPIDIPVTATPNAAFHLITPTVIVKLFPSGIIDVADAATFLLISQYPDMSYRLTADIDLTDVPFSGIGTTAKPFTGVFDGNGHIIKGAKYESPSERNVGLFRSARGATIKKLGLEGARFIGNEDTGGLIGYSDNTTIEESYVADSYIEGRDHVGSIVGALRTGSVIRNSYSTARVHSREHQAGGLSGTIATKGTIENSYFSGIVSNIGGRAVGIGGYQDGGNVAEDIVVKNSVNLAPYLLSNNYPNVETSAIRIFDNNRDRAMTLTNNYSLSTTRLGKPDYSVSSIVATDDANYGLDKRHGTNVSPEDARTEDFYKTTLGWNFDATWKITSGGYPVLQWQTAPVASTLYITKEWIILKETATADLGLYVFSSRGLPLSFNLDNEVTTLNNGIVSIGDDIEAWDASILTITNAGDANFAAVNGSLKISVFPTTPIAIADEDQLDILHYELGADFYLSDDITLTRAWTPTATFSGTLEGKGHVIKGLRFDNTQQSQVGLFSNLTGSVKQLGIENANIVGDANIGAIAGQLLGGTIEESYVADSYIEGRDHVGSITGNITTAGIIRNSYASATVYSRQYQCGGLVGTTDNNDGGKILNSYFSGKASVNSTNRVGGILALVNGGNARTVIENCVTLAEELKSSDAGNSGIYRITSQNGATVALTNNYALETITNINGNDSEKGTDVTLEDAKDQEWYETVLTWNFEDVWYFDSENDYPVLSVFYSDDATLSDLSVEEGVISPAFDAAVTAYTLNVANEVESVTVHATPNHPGAHAVVSGATGLQVGANTVTVTVTAENSSTKAYVITVTRAQFTSVKDVETPDVKVYSENNTIYASFNGNTSIRLYSATGQLINETVAAGNYQQAVKQGVYILSIQGKVYKVVTLTH